VRGLRGKELVAYDIFVAPPSTFRRFLDQRVRQAATISPGLAVGTCPVSRAACRRGDPLRGLGLLAIATAAAAAALAAAEKGHLRAGAGRYFSVLASIAAPLWILERGISAWLAIATRLVHMFRLKKRP
jgi:hypothetical protein